uniref:Uncharacterized protein n=1 Tax=Amphimedon queenslandica TaxID=400682 RepID=A0A1X7SH13_AMPQE
FLNRTLLYSKPVEHTVVIFHDKETKLNGKLINAFRKAVATWYCRINQVKRQYNNWTIKYIEGKSVQDYNEEICKHIYCLINKG